MLVYSGITVTYWRIKPPKSEFGSTLFQARFLLCPVLRVN